MKRTLFFFLAAAALTLPACSTLPPIASDACYYAKQVCRYADLVCTLVEDSTAHSAQLRCAVDSLEAARSRLITLVK